MKNPAANLQARANWGVLLAILCTTLPVHAQPLEWDPDFAPRILAPGTIDPPPRLLPLRDGRLFMVGTFRRAHDVDTKGIVRFKADGSFDEAFAYAGERIENGDVVVPLDDGWFLVVHGAGAGGLIASTARLRRYREDGSTDSAFVEMHIPSGVVEGFVRTPDGSVLVFGRFGTIGSVSAQGLVRFTSDGSLDATFAPDLLGGASHVRGAAIDANGFIIVSANLATQQLLTRLDPAGNRDPTFAPAIIPTESIHNQTVPAPPLLVQQDGRILFRGGDRLNADGSLASEVPPPPPIGLIGLSGYYLHQAVELPNGDLVAEITTFGDPAPTTTVRRITSEGAFIRYWPTYGLVGLTAEGNVISQPSRSPMWVDDPFGPARQLWRDPAFEIHAPDETLISAGQPGTEYLSVVDHVVRRDDGRILVSGPFASVENVPRRGLAQLQEDGRLDSSFVPPDSLGRLVIAALAPDGGLWVYRLADPNSSTFVLERLNPDGSLDSTPPANSELRTADAQIVGRDTSGQFLVSILDPSTSSSPRRLEIATCDPTTGERVDTWPTLLESSNSHLRGVVPLSDGSLLIDGFFGQANGQATTLDVNGWPVGNPPLRLLPDGAVDGDYRARMQALKVTYTHQLLPDGRALVAVVEATEGYQATRIVRIDRFGVVEPGFAFPTDPLSMPRLIPQPDGSYVARTTGIQRWRANGSRDLNAVPDFNATVVDAFKSPARDLLLTGSFGIRRLIPTSATGITLAPVSQTAYVGHLARFLVEVADAGVPNYQWQRNGVDIPGANSSTFDIARTSLADAGLYRAVVNINGITYQTDTVELRVRLIPARLVNFSARSRITNGSPQIGGFVLRTPSSRPVLLRAVSQGLAPIAPQLQSSLTPRLTLFEGDNWHAENGGADLDTVILALAERVGAFPAVPRYAHLFPWVVFHCAFAGELGSGQFTAHTSSTDGNEGISLFEFYDAGELTEPGDVLNVSLRGRTAPGDDTLIGGFAIAGQQELTLLLRVIGEELSKWDVDDVLTDPQLTLFAGSAIIAANNDWADTTAEETIRIEQATTDTGAFPLADDSKSAAIVVTLEPGAYTVHATGGSAAGEVLLEIYVVEE